MGEEYASTIYYNGTIIPMTGRGNTVEAVAAAGERILACGSWRELEQYVGPKTKKVDLGGATMLPGFYDAHSHFAETGTGRLIYLNLNCAPFGEMVNIEDCLTALIRKAEGLPEGKSVIGSGYNNDAILEKRHLTRHDLDLVSTEHPVIVDHVTSHFMYVNSKALEIAGITKDTPDPQGGRIQRGEDGGPNGILEENATDLIWFKEELGFLGTREEKIRGLENASDYYASMGYTTANQGSLGGVDILEEGLAGGYLKIRCVLWCPVDQVVEYHEKGIQPSSNMITLAGGKAFQDGSIQCGTAYLTKPYYTTIPGHTADYCGMHIWDKEELAEMVKKVHNAGQQMHIHCNGDAAIDEVLYAYEQAQRENPRPDPRHVVVHAQAARLDQLQKMKELGVVPTFYVPAIQMCGDEQVSTYLGPKRCEHYNPIKTAMDMGLRPTLHTDCPVMPPDPLKSIQTAVTRQSKSGQVIGPDERLDVYEALLASTVYGAYQNHEENCKGSLEPGKLADFVILDRNPLEVDPQELSKLKVLSTIVGDREVYRAE